MRALLLEKDDNGLSAAVKEVDEALLPEGEVTVAISHSTLNYKDGGVITGALPLVRKFPHVPGIDFAGEVVESADPRWKAGDAVALTGWGVGEGHWGGYAEKARVKADWLVRLPDGLTAKRAMAVGTAGLTSMLAIQALEDHGLKPENGPVLVLGATGGVGSVAVALLAAMGCEVAAVTGKAEEADYLTSLGATQVIDRAEFAEAGKPLDKALWAGCVDAVAGVPLARALSQMKYGASVAAVGLAASPKLETTVFPLLLRGVNILGIDSVYCPLGPRERAWKRLVELLDMAKLDAMTAEIGLDEVVGRASEIVKGGVKGRLVVDLAR